MEMEPVSSCHSQRSTKQSSGRGSSSSSREVGDGRRRRWGQSSSTALPKLVSLCDLAWLGFSGLGVAVGCLDRPAQIADAYVEYADMSHTHTHAHYYSNYTYNAVLAI